MSNASEEFLTVAEIAAALRVNQQTVRNWIDHQALPAFRVGRRVRVLRSDLAAFIEAGATAPKASVQTPPVTDRQALRDAVDQAHRVLAGDTRENIEAALVALSAAAERLLAGEPDEPGQRSAE